MNEYLHENGFTYTERELMIFARENNETLEDYLKSRPELKLKSGKEQGSTGDPTVSPSTMGSDLEIGSSESPKQDSSWFDNTWFGRGWAAASTTGEATDLILEGSNVKMETIQEFIKAKEQEAKEHVPSERMQKFQKQYEKEGSSWTAFFRGVRRDPALMAELFIQSLGTQLGTLADTPAEALTAAGTGAAVGAGATAYLGAGAIAGGLAGAMGGLATTMESALTFGELIEEELKKEGKEFTDKNIKALLEGPKGKSIRNRAIGRGLTIGAVEGFTGGVAGKVTTGVLKGAGKAVSKTRKVGAAATGVGVEAIGGGTGEVLGRVAADQEMDPAEIGFEAITGTVTAPVNVGNALLTYKKPVYKLNGKEVTYAEMKDFVETAEDIDVAKANIVMDNDLTGLDAIANEKQQKAIIKSQIDEKITDKKDIDALLNLAVKRDNAKADLKKEGISQVPGAEKALLDIESQINDIIGKYEGATDVAITQEAADVRKAVRENKISDTIAFAETQGKKIGKETIVVDDNEQAQVTFDKLREEYNKNITDPKEQIKAQNVKDADGFIIGDSIIINKDIAGRTGAINVGAHEVLHGVLAKHMQSLDIAGKKKLISSFKNVLSKKQLAAVTTRLQDNYKDQIAEDPNFMDTTDEWFTAFSDAIEQNEITFDEGVFDKIKNTIQEILRKFNIKKDFANGRQAYNFLKDYSKSIKKNKLSSRALALAGEGTAVTDVKKSVSPLEAIKALVPKTVKTQEDYYALLDDPSVTERILSPTGKLAPVIEAYIRSRSTSPEMAQKNIETVRDRLVNFDPAAKRADGSIVGPEGFGEFIFANARFGKMVAAEKLAIEAAERKRTKSIDTEEAMQIADKPTKKKPELKGQKRREIQSLSNVYGVANEVTLNNKIQALIEKNPKNLEAEIRKLIEKDIRKAITKQMGKISKKKGEVVISDEYKAFLALNYENTVQGLDVATIKKNYNQLFELTEIGKEDRKTRKADKPSLKKDSNYRKGIFKIETNKAKFTKFFTEGGYTTLLDRQKKLAILIGESITENIINDQITENSKNLNDITKVKMKEFANSLNRQKKEVQGNYNDQIKFSKNSMKDANMLKSLVEEKGLSNVFSDKGKLLPKWKKKLLEPNNEKASDFIYSIAKQGYIQDLSDLQYISKLYDKIYKAGERGTAFEASIIDTIKELEAEFGEATVYAVLRKPTEADAMPDVVMRIHNTLLNIEAKMSNAQYSSVTFAVDKNGNFNIKKNYSFNNQILGLGKQVQAGIKATRARLKKERYDWNDISIMPTHLYEIIKNEPVTIDGVEYSSYLNAMSATMPISLDVVSEIYNNKKHPVNYMHMMGRGLFYMGGYNNETNVLGTPELKGNAEITLRIGSNTQKQTVTIQEGVKMKIPTGNKRLSWRAIPTIPNKTLETLKPHSKTLDTKTGIKNIVNSKEGKALALFSKSKKASTLNNAVKMSRSISDPKGITVLDFDDTLATTKSLVKFTTPEGETGTLNAEQYASTYEDLLDQGYTFDFSDFNKVVKGKLAPLFNKAMKLQSKFGPENMFVLTARPPAAQKAIFDFLKANGLNIPLKNITGLGNSTAEAKALWIADKVGEGYNDFYFADDALQNVQAVKNMLDQFDVKSKVQQAKVKFSKSMNKDFNDILENVTGIESKKRFSAVKARKRGESKGKFRFFIPPSHEDFVGLLYNFIGKGKEGNKHRDFFEQALIRPLNRAYRELNAAKQSIANDYKSLNKQFADVKKKLIKKTPDGDFTYQDAIRVYLWDKHGHDISGLSETDQQSLVDLVNNDQELKQYAETLNIISKQDKYVAPTESWEAGDIRTDLDDATGRIGRAEFFSEFLENVETIFSQENLNKIEAAYGADVVSAIKDMLYRIKTGQNRPSGQNKLVNKFLNYLNGSVASTMFFNIRSAVLQQMSMVNFINFADNNIIAAAKAFANQKQYWTDWATIFNSDFMKQRRKGIQTDVNGAELAASVKNAKNPIQAAIKKLLELGFLPTQIGDNIAIATGGATFLRNRINTYLKQGLSQKEAEAKAFVDFEILAEATQQSARPDMVSQQQASPLGKVILAFQNVTSQFNRLGKKAFLDIKNRRITPGNQTQLQSDASNLSRIAYYFAIQNLIFYSLQSALFMMMFDDNEDDEKFLKKKERAINGSIDSVLRGTGVWGSAIATLKNMAIKWHEQRDKGYNADESAVLMEMLNVSPPLGIKARKLVNAEKTLNYNKKTIDEMETFDIDNPMWSAVTSYTEATTNIPLNRLYNKTQNVRESLNNQHDALERVLLFSGWSKWNLGIEDVSKSKKKEKFGGKKKTKKKTLKKFY